MSRGRFDRERWDRTWQNLGGVEWKPNAPERDDLDRALPQHIRHDRDEARLSHADIPQMSASERRAEREFLDRTLSRALFLRDRRLRRTVWTNGAGHGVDAYTWLQQRIALLKGVARAA
jgi:hypothetical protein